MESQAQFIAALDIGTTSVRCHILDKSATSIGKASAKVELKYPGVGRVEIDPESLWEKIVQVLQDAITAANVTAKQIKCLGICTQRCSFTIWDRETGRTLINFITWKDVRADSLVRQWNDSFTMKGLRIGARCLYMVTRSKRFLAGSVLRLMNTQVTLRLVWVLDNVPGVRAAAEQGKVMFGTVDTWLLYRLTGGKVHLTDVSNASATGFYDPFTMKWGDWGLNLFQIPKPMLPEVVDTAGDFGTVMPDILGAAIPIRCSMADQAASLFGSCCFHEGDLKMTLGTGTFINVNTGRKPLASIKGLYPQVAWRVGDELVFSFEGTVGDTGSLVVWAQQVGLLTDPAESAQMAASVEDSNGLFFIPAFSGLQAPINDYRAASGFLGVKPTTTRHHMVRAILESIVFRVCQLYEALQEEAKYRYNTIRIDGGVSSNDFVGQMLAEMTGLDVERSTTSEMSVMGAGFLAGITAGLWKSKDEVCSLRQVERVFKPHPQHHHQHHHHHQQGSTTSLSTWSRAVDRFLEWYDDSSK